MAVNDGHLLVCSLVSEEQNNLDECNKIWKKKKKEVTIGSSTSFKGPSTVHHKEVEAYNSDCSNGV